MIKLCPKRDLNLGPSRIAVFEDFKATALTTQPPRLDQISKLVINFHRSIFLEKQYRRNCKKTIWKSWQNQTKLRKSKSDRNSGLIWIKTCSFSPWRSVHYYGNKILFFSTLWWHCFVSFFLENYSRVQDCTLKEL